MDEHQKTDSHQALMSLLLKHRHRIFGFIFTLVPNRADAEDLLQEASIVMWEKFGDFSPGTDFVAWANQIAYFCVKDFRRRRARSKLQFTDILLGDLVQTANALGDEVDARHGLLQGCLDELDERDRCMILTRYAADGSVARAANAVDRTIAATYKSLSRLRRALADCVTRKLASGGAQWH